METVQATTGAVRSRPPGGDGVEGGPGGAPRDGGSPSEPGLSAPAGAGGRGPSAAGPVLDATAREKLVKQAAGKSTREVQQMLAEVDPELAQPSDRMRALGNGALEVEGGGRRGVPAWAVGGVLGRATYAAGLHFEAGERSVSRAPVRGRHRFTSSAAKRLEYAAGVGAVGPVGRSPAVERHLAALSCFGALRGSRSRYIPAAVRREVWRRDGGCCSYIDRHSGRRCGSRYRLEIDHIVPFALGGGAEPDNSRLHCGAHHRLRNVSAMPTL